LLFLLMINLTLLVNNRSSIKPCWLTVVGFRLLVVLMINPT
jgi:hypothetical protein